MAQVTSRENESSFLPRSAQAVKSKMQLVTRKAPTLTCQRSKHLLGEELVLSVDTVQLVSFSTRCGCDLCSFFYKCLNLNFLIFGNALFGMSKSV